LLKAGVDDALGHSEEVVQAMSDAGRGIPLEKLLHALSEFGKADFRRDAFSPLPLELAVLGAVAGPAPQPAAPAAAAPTTPAPPGRSPAGGPPARAAAPRGQPPAPQRSAPPRAAPPRTAAPVAGEGTADSRQPRRPRTPADERWATLVRNLSRARGVKYNLGALLRDVESAEVAGEELNLKFRNGSIRERMAEELENPGSRSEVESAAAQLYGARLSVRLVDGGAAPGAGTSGSAMDSALVRAAVTMGARIIDEETEAGAPPPDSDRSG
jgi:hypothetical protein